MKKRKSGKLRTSSRDCPTYLGEANNTRYWTTSITKTSTPWLEDQAILEYKEGRALAATNISVQYKYGVEEISSVYGRKKVFNNCAHTKLIWCNLPFLICFKVYNAAYNTKLKYYRKNTTRQYAPSIARLGSAWGENVQPGGDQNFSGRAFWSMRPRFEGEVSLINSVFELKDFRGVLKPRKIYTALSNALSSKYFSKEARNFVKEAESKNINATMFERRVKTYEFLPQSLTGIVSSTTGTAATAQLTISLAIKPTIADVLGIIAQMRVSAQEAQKTFQEYGELGTTSHFSETVHQSSSTIRGTLNNYPFGEGTSVKVVRTATMRSYYEYKMRSYNQALDRYWGLSGTIEALWNMLPLSFVLDYVWTIGKTLEYMARDENVTSLTTEYCESVKVLVTDGLHIVQEPRVYSVVVDGKFKPYTSTAKPHLVSGTQYTRYNRKVMQPYKGPALPRFKMPSTNQAANMLALARVILF